MNPTDLTLFDSTSFTYLLLAEKTPLEKEDLATRATAAMRFAVSSEEYRRVVDLFDKNIVIASRSLATDLAALHGKQKAPKSEKLLLEQVYDLATKACENNSLLAVVPAETFLQGFSIKASFLEGEQEICAYDLFLLSVYSEFTYSQLENRESSFHFPLVPFVVFEKIIAHFKKEPISFSLEEWRSFMDAVDFLHVDKQALEALTPLYARFLEEESYSLQEILKHLFYFTHSFSLIKLVDAPLLKRVKKETLTVEEKTRLLHLFREHKETKIHEMLRKFYTPLALLEINQGGLSQDLLSLAPPLGLTITPKNIGLLNNSTIQRLMTHCDIENGPKEFYLEVLQILEKESPTAMKHLFVHDFSFLRNVKEKYGANRDVVLAAVKNNGWELEHASLGLQSDREVILTAVQKSGHPLQFASEELRNDKEVVLTAVQKIGSAFRFASEELRNDKEVILAAIQNDGHILRFISEELRNDRDITLAAVQKNGWPLKYANEEFRNDKEIVLTAVQTSEQALEFASEELQGDRDIVLTAVQKSGWALKYASLGLRNDKEVLLAAVQNNGHPLQFASEELRNDRGIVLAAVQKTGCALRFASPALQNDEEVIKTAIQQNVLAAQFIGTRLKSSPL